jgi:hypothetical protein
VFIGATSARAAERTRTIAVSGTGSTPGTPVPSNPALVKFQTFGWPTIDERGVVTFQARLSDPRYPYTETGLYVGTAPTALAQVLRSETPAPGFPAGSEVTQISTYTSVGSMPYANQSAQTGQAVVMPVVRTGTHAAAATMQVPYLGNGSGGLEPLAVSGQPTPSGKGTWGGFYAVAVNPSGAVVVHDRNKHTLWTGTSAASLAPLVDRGFPQNQFLPIEGFTLSRDGGVAYAVREANAPVGGPGYGTTVAYHAAGTTVTRLLGSGDTLPGASGTVTTVYAPRTNLSGQFVVGAVAGTWRGAWVGSVSDVASGGALQKVAAPGDAAPGLPGYTIKTVTAPVVSAGRVYVNAELNGPDVSFGNSHAIYAAPLSSPASLELIVREGTAFRGMAAGWSLDASADQFVVNAADQMLLYGYTALIGYDRSLGLVPLAKIGDRVEVSPGVFKTLADRFILGEDDYLAVDGSWNDGMPRALSDQGVVSYRAKFTDGTQALLTTRIPVAGDATADGVVDQADFKILVRNLGKQFATPDRATADFNLDGRVDFSDFQLMELNYGRRPLGWDGPTGAAGGAEEFQALATAAGVPEPASAAWLTAGTAALGLSRRRRRRRG